MDDGNQDNIDIYKNACDSALAGIAIADLQGELLQVNPAFLDMWGYTDEEEVVGQSVTDFWADPEEAQAVATTVVEEGEWEGELLAEKQNGTTFHARASASLVTNDEGTPVSMMSSFEDISERVSRERELHTKNNQLEQFANVLSHDLQNPLNVAQSRVELAQTECDSEHLEDALTALDRAYAIIDDVLTLAQEGDRVAEIESVDLAATVEECWQTVPTAAATLESETTQEIKADESRLKQLLENLLRNAVEHGGSDVTVTIGELEDGFYVADDGPGMPENVHEQEFAANSASTVEGSGFGLSIVHQIADAHGWKVDLAESDAGGVRFEITGV